jgi:nucleoside-diphosphate-sugar epimerase
LGVALHQGGNTVCGSTTKIDKLAVLQTHGITPFLIRLPLEDVTDVSFFQSDVLVVNIPPRRKAGLTDEYLQHLEQLRNFLLTTSLRKIVFISSTSVYPDVNREVTEADASTESYAYKAEQIFFSSPFQTTVLRFGGLFGPGRNAGIFFAGKIDIPGADSPVNLIHLDDCIAIISAIIRDGVWNEIFNACADEHPTRKNFYTTMAMQAGLVLPTFSTVSLDWKRVSSEKLKQKLGYSFKVSDPMVFK